MDREIRGLNGAGGVYPVNIDCHSGSDGVQRWERTPSLPHYYRQGVGVAGSWTGKSQSVSYP
jgi:hypothetical protein